MQGCSRRSGARLRHPASVTSQSIGRSNSRWQHVGHAPDLEAHPTAMVRSTASVGRSSPSVAEAVAASSKALRGSAPARARPPRRPPGGGMPWRSSGIGTPGVHARTSSAHGARAPPARPPPALARLHARPAPTGAGRAGAVGPAEGEPAWLQASDQVVEMLADCRGQAPHDARPAGAHASPAHVCAQLATRRDHGTRGKPSSIWYGWRSNGGITWHEEGTGCGVTPRRSRPAGAQSAQIGGESGDGVSSPLGEAPRKGDRSTLERPQPCARPTLDAYPRYWLPINRLARAEEPVPVAALQAFPRRRSRLQPAERLLVRRPAAPPRQDGDWNGFAGPRTCAAPDAELRCNVRSARLTGERSVFDEVAREWDTSPTPIDACDTPLRAAVDSGACRTKNGVVAHPPTDRHLQPLPGALASLSLLPPATPRPTPIWRRRSARPRSY